MRRVTKKFAVPSVIEVAFAIFAAAYEGQVQRDSDRRGGWRFICSRFTELLADQQSMAAQCLWARPSVDREQVAQDVSRNPKRHQRRLPGLQLVQLRDRPTVRRPTDTGLATAAAGAQKSRKFQPHLAERLGAGPTPESSDFPGCTTKFGILSVPWRDPKPAPRNQDEPPTAVAITIATH